VLKQYPTAKSSVLGNGLKIVSEPSNSDQVTVGVAINAGSRYEREDNNGVAHFLEHLMFKGTGKRTRTQLESEVEQMGAQLNAYTTRETTLFYITAFKKDADQAVDIISDMVLNSKLSASSVDEERGVILREAEDVESKLQEVIFERLHQTAYRGTSMARPILGSEANIKSITKADVEQYVKTHYVAPRMSLVAAGNIDHGKLVGLAEKHFSQVPSKAPNGIDAVKPATAFTGSDIRIHEDDMPFAHLAYGFETGGWHDADNYPLMVLQMILDSWNHGNTSGIHSSSPLIPAVASQRLAESISPFNTIYSDTGLFGVYAVADATTLDELMTHMPLTITNLVHNLPPELVEEAKNKLRVALLGSLDGQAAVFDDLARNVAAFGRRLHPLEVLQRVEQVDALQIQDVIRRRMYDHDYALAAMGPIFELPDYLMIHRRTWTARI
jgi:processing peptidase subunit beta